MKRFLILVLLVVGLLASFGAVQAQTPTPTPSKVPIATPTPVRHVFLYSVKFICGLEQPPTNLRPPQEPPVKPGNYATAVNVHNFGPTNLCVAKKAVVAFPESQPGQLIGSFVPFKLVPDGAFEIDCTDIVSLLHVPTLPPFIKGFVEIQSSVQLNVQAVYTSQTCHTSPSVAGCTSLGELALEVVPEPFFNAISTSTVCGL